MRAIVLDAHGGPERLRAGRADRPATPDGYALIHVERAGVNYFDLERRAAGWRDRTVGLPAILGTEVAGTRVDDGTRVIGLTDGGFGGYAEYAAVRDELAVPIPAGVDDTSALAMLIQGLTAWHIVATAARVRPGEAVVVTAAAGGVGSLAVQIARLHGAGRVIAVASTEDKRRLARELGAYAAIDGDPDGFADRVRAANDGAPVDVVLESVAGPIVDAALDALAPDGRIVVYGQASGASNTVSLDLLMSRGIGVHGYWLTPSTADGARTRRTVQTLLDHVAAGRLRVVPGPAFPIGQAAKAHAAIAARATTGKVTLTVDDAAWEQA